MKYIKNFENLELDIDDYVKLINGDYAKIINIITTSEQITYVAQLIYKSNKLKVFLYSYIDRLMTTEEIEDYKLSISANIYNL